MQWSEGFARKKGTISIQIFVCSQHLYLYAQYLYVCIVLQCIFIMTAMGFDDIIHLLVCYQLHIYLPVLIRHILCEYTKAFIWAGIDHFYY